jgi:uncharacterized protein YoxC
VTDDWSDFFTFLAQTVIFFAVLAVAFAVLIAMIISVLKKFD